MLATCSGHLIALDSVTLYSIRSLQLHSCWMLPDDYSMKIHDMLRAITHQDLRSYSCCRILILGLLHHFSNYTFIYVLFSLI
jgi:hypothetical protein